MKNILILLAIITMFSSCTKKGCWDCRLTHAYQSTPNAFPIKEEYDRKCGTTRDGINKFEQESRYDSAVINNQGMPDTLLIRTNCQKAKQDLDDFLTPDLNLSFN